MLYRFALSDQLSSDLASLKIQRDVDPERGGPLRTVLIVAVVVGLSAAGYFFAYPQLKAEIFKTEVATTEVVLVSPAQASITVTSTGYVIPRSARRSPAGLRACTSRRGMSSRKAISSPRSKTPIRRAP